MSDSVAKKLLEQKLYLASERPDELFDLSGCSLDEVPHGTYSLVKVYRKTHLLLQNNRLRNLEGGGNLSDLTGLKLLDLNSNKVNRVPDGFCHMVSLEALILAENEICVFPASLVFLQNLRLLNVEGNRVTSIPEEIGQLHNLVDLRLARNPIVELPQQISRLSKLRKLTLPSESLKYPPPDVCSQGISAILRFLGGGDASNTSEGTPAHSPVTADSVDSLMPKPMLDDARLRALELEHLFDESRQAQTELMASASENRQKVLSQLVQEQLSTHADITALQRKREHEHSGLVLQLLDAEDNALTLINEILAKNEKAKDLEVLDDENNLKLADAPDKSFNLRREEMLLSMQEMLAITDEAFREHTTALEAVTRRTLSEKTTTHDAVDAALVSRYRKQLQLTSEIALTLDTQKEAFAKLQTQQDTRIRRLHHNIALIALELRRLTMVEQKRKAERIEMNHQCLTKRRQELVHLLNQLNEQQRKRHAELRRRLNEMESRRVQDQTDYWLIQYQRLLENKPAALDSDVEPELHMILVKARALDFLPNFQYHKVTYNVLLTLTDADLQKVGVYAIGVRQSILQAAAAEKLKDSHKPEVIDYGSDKPPLRSPEVSRQPLAPSAPPLDLIARFENECCVCQNAQCAIIFIQCGHACVCVACSSKLSLCPLCRTAISRRIQFQY